MHRLFASVGVLGAKFGVKFQVSGLTIPAAFLAKWGYEFGGSSGSRMDCTHPASPGTKMLEARFFEALSRKQYRLRQVLCGFPVLSGA